MIAASRFREVRALAAEPARLARLFLTSPRDGLHRLERCVGALRAAILLRDCERGELVNALGHVRVVAEGRIRLGDRVQLAGGMFPTELVCHAGAELSIGDSTLLNYGVSIEARVRVVVGRRCMLASGVRVRDCADGEVGPVVIGDDVWLAYGVIVEPGVTIGDAAVVAAGSVVRADVPARSLCSGNPAISIPLTAPRAPSKRESWTT